MEVEVREPRVSNAPIPVVNSNSTPFPVQGGGIVVVRIEEVLLVILVLSIWIAAIALFFNRWGKIRMLEPYQPKFHQQAHRPSCPMAPLSPPLPQINPALPRKSIHPRMSFSKYNVNAMTDVLSVLPSPIIRKPRRSSVFVGSSPSYTLNTPPRRVQSAMDIQHLVINETSPTSLSGSCIPILNRDRRSSMVTERSVHNPRHRPSIFVDRPLVALQLLKTRRSSCFVERPVTNYGRYLPNLDRRRSVNIDKPPPISLRHQTTTVSCEPNEPIEQPMVVVEVPYVSEPVPLLTLPKTSRSFEHPAKQKLKPERNATSLEITPLSIQEEDPKKEDSDCDQDPPVVIYLDDCKITAPLLDSLKSSDV